jgi:hypothetical protein
LSCASLTAPVASFTVSSTLSTTSSLLASTRRRLPDPPCEPCDSLHAGHLHLCAGHLGRSALAVGSGRASPRLPSSATHQVGGRNAGAVMLADEVS